MEDGFGLSGISTIRDGVPWAKRSRKNKVPDLYGEQGIGCAKVTKDPGEGGHVGQRKT